MLRGCLVLCGCLFLVVVQSGCSTPKCVQAYEGEQKSDQEIARIFAEIPMVSVAKDFADSIAIVKVDERTLRGRPTEITVLPGTHELLVRFFDDRPMGRMNSWLADLLLASWIRKVDEKHCKILPLDAKAGHTYLIKYGVSHSSDTFKNPTTRIISYTIEDHGEGYVGGPVSLQRAPIRR